MLKAYQYISSKSMTPQQITTMLGLALGGVSSVPSQPSNEIKKYWLLNCQDSLSSLASKFNELYPVNIDTVLDLAYLVFVRRYYAVYEWSNSELFKFEQYKQSCESINLYSSNGASCFTDFYNLVKDYSNQNESLSPVAVGL